MKCINTYLTLLLVSLTCHYLYAQAGILDSTFGTNGYIVYPQSSYATSLAVQPDGKIVIGGYASGVLFMRVNSDGTFDSTFGTNGLKPFALSNGYSCYQNQIELQKDGSIMAVGAGVQGSAEPLVCRVKADGSLDSSFGQGTVASIVFASLTGGFGCSALDSGNNIFVAGGSYISRLNQQGTNAYGVETNLSTNISSMQIQPDQKVVICGRMGNIGHLSRQLINANNFFMNDNSFGTSGLVTLSDSNISYIFNILRLQQDGKILVGGSIGPRNNGDFLLIRFNINGSIDSTFGINGKVTTDFFGFHDEINSMEIQTDGKIVVTGWAYLASSNKSAIAIARYTKFGFLDSTFAVGGKDTLTVPGFALNQGFGINFLSPTRIVVVGTLGIQSESVLICYKNDDFIPVQQLCLVTCDSLARKNVVVWNKVNRTATDSFYVYRTNTPDSVFSFITSIAADSLSEYEDLTSLPDSMSYRYKINIKDINGNYSTMSNYHQTIWLQSLQHGLFTWTPYLIENETSPVNSYDFYRDSTGTGGWQLLASITPSQTNYNDTGYHLYPNAAYKVVVELDSSCSPSRGITTITSNILQHVNLTLVNSVEPDEIRLLNNPVHSEILLMNIDKTATVDIMNELGQPLNRETIVGGSAVSINVSAYACGIYYIKIIDGNVLKVLKVLKY